MNCNKAFDRGIIYYQKKKKNDLMDIKNLKCSINFNSKMSQYKKISGKTGVFFQS